MLGDGAAEGAAAGLQAFPLREGMHEGYAACAEWAAQGLARDALATRILQRIFALWPREAADYQRRYDAYLEKELQHPYAVYYASSRVWMTDVDNLRTRVTCACRQGETIGERLLRRAVKLLHTHPERLAAVGPATTAPAGVPSSLPQSAGQVSR